MSNNVYQLISAVAGELAHEGISKDRKNQQQGYQFRGIDDVYNALSPIMSKHGLVILPRILSRELTERQSAKGGVIFSVTVEAEFDFISSHDGSKHTVKTFGEAMDSADKATNKAMSAAYKYAAFQAFCIPTEGDNDADSTTHAVVAEKKQEKKELLPAMTSIWNNAKNAYLRDSNLDAVKERYKISEFNEKKLIAECDEELKKIEKDLEDIPQ